MALRVCPDCGKEYSTLAKICPNCGRPNEEFLENAGSRLHKQMKRESCEAGASLAKMELIQSVATLVFALVVCYICIEIGGGHEGIEDITDVLRVYLVPTNAIFYMLIFFRMGYGIITSFLGWILLTFGTVFLCEHLPNFLAIIVMGIWVLIPIYSLFVRPFVKLFSLTKNTLGKKTVKDSSGDKIIRQMYEADQL